MDRVLSPEENYNVMQQRDRLLLLTGFARAKSKRWHSLIDEYERDYYMAVTGDVTPNKTPEDMARLSDLGDIVEASKNIFLRSSWKVYADRPADMEQDKLKAGALERFLRATIDRKTEVQIVDFQSRFGAAVHHWAFDPTPRPWEDDGSPLERAPISSWVIDPRTFHPMPGGPDGWCEYVVHIEPRSLFATYQLATSVLADNPFALQQLERDFGHILPEQRYVVEYDFCDYWGWHQVGGQWVVVNAVLYGNTILRPFTVMAGYNHLPWALIPARDTNHKELDKRWLPLTYHTRPHVRHAERLQGMATTMFEKAANFPFVITLDERFQTPPDIRSGQDHFITLQPGQQFSPPPIAGLPRDFYGQMELVDNRIQKSGFPRGIFGITGPASGQNSGYGYEQQQEGGVLRLGEPAEHLQEGMVRFFRGVCSLLSRHTPEQPIYVARDEKSGERVVLTGKDLAGWKLSVKWRTELPNEKMRKIAMATQAVGANLTSLETAREMYLDIEDPQRETELILKEKVLSSHPDIVEAKAFQTLWEMGALPNFDLASRFQFQMKVQEAASKLQAMGAPPQVIQDAIQKMVQAEYTRLLMEYMRPPVPPAGAPPGGPRSTPGGGPGKGNRDPKPNNDQQRQMNQPGLGNAGAQRAGQPPAGNPQDVSAPLRNMANQMRINQ